MPNQTSPWLEHHVLIHALGNPGLGPRRLAAEMALPRWGGLQISATAVFNVPRRHGLNTRRRRLSLVVGYASPPEPEPAARSVPLHIEADKPGYLVQLDCFHIGRLTSMPRRLEFGSRFCPLHLTVYDERHLEAVAEQLTDSLDKLSAG